MGSENRSDERLGGVVGPLDERGEFCRVRAASKPPVRYRGGVGDGEIIGGRLERGSESVDCVALQPGKELVTGALNLRDVGRTPVAV